MDGTANTGRSYSLVRMELALVIAVAVLVAGVVGSLIPVVPGPLFSLVGVVGYWISSGFEEPGTLFLLVVIVLCLLAIGAEIVASAVSAKAGGGSARVGLLAGGVGIVLLFVFGPIGLLVGVAGTAIVVEFYRTGEPEHSVRAGVYTTIGVLASSALKLAVTLAVLIGFVLVVVL